MDSIVLRAAAQADISKVDRTPSRRYKIQFTKYVIIIVSMEILPTKTLPTAVCVAAKRIFKAFKTILEV